MSYLRKTFQASLLLGLALTSSTSFAINSCNLTVSAFDFGVYYPMQASPLDITGSINVRCFGGRGSFVIGLSTGMSNSYSLRSLFLNTSVLNYNLYTDSAHTTVWGDISSPNVIVGTHQGGWWWWDWGQNWGPGGWGWGWGQNGNWQNRFNVDFYGRVFANQDPRPGLYNDLLTVTVQF